MAKSIASELTKMSNELRAGNRQALARAITLVESTRHDHRETAEQLIATLLANTGRTVRLGISGPPGVGKSTFIESLGSYLVGNEHKIAVLAVDPSSTKGHGSVLGDKTRMPKLSQTENVFIRPSPSGGALGGVSRRTREAVLVCEAAGYDVIMVETVGVGQSETTVRDMVDMFILLAQPASGDELQGIKRGVVEIADLVVVNKADGELLSAARRTQSDYSNALQLFRARTTDWSTPVLTCSALYDQGIREIWQTVEQYCVIMGKNGSLSGLRRQQAIAWMWSEIRDTLNEKFRSAPIVAKRISDIERKVSNGHLAPTTAAKSLLSDFLNEI